MTHIKIICSVSALLFGIALVIVSLVSASQVHSRGLDVAQKELYFEETLLPDHALYPVLMVRDKVVLELAQPVNRVLLQIEYAQKRIHAAELLFEKGKQELALSTATKAQKYLLLAVLESQSAELDEQMRVRALEALRAQTNNLIELQDRFSGEQHAILLQLIRESQSLLE